jgi:hypothetical protein
VSAAALRLAVPPAPGGNRTSVLLSALAAGIEEAQEEIAERVAQKVLAALAKPERATLDRNELALALGISISSLDRLRAQPGFPELRIGEAPRFLLADVLAHLKRGAK